ncbi:hypothetical protein [Alicyclobacillus macrosporangiidus]|nr:hypothetical protein [Alicyclobacillus macrosporangiidus]
MVWTVETIDLRKVFDGRIVLDSVSLAVPAGSIHGVVGPTAPARARCCAS